MRTRGALLGRNTRPPRSAPARGPLGGRGFSLVELVLVITVVVVIAAVAAPRWGAASARYRADALARRIAADLDRTRQTARARGATLGATFDVASNSYAIPNVSELDHRAGKTELSIGLGVYRGKLTRVDFGGGSVAAFSGLGVPVLAGEVQVAVGAETRIIEVEAETGIVRVYRLKPNEADPLVAVREFVYAVDGPRIDASIGQSGVSISVGGASP